MFRHQRTTVQASEQTDAHAARLAWLAAFVTTVVLALGLSIVHNANAATLPAGAPLGPSLQIAVAEPEDDEGEEEEEGFEGGEVCEEIELEIEAGESDEEEVEELEFELEECEEEAEEDETPPQCKLEEADAAVSADLVHRKLHLALRYSAYKSTSVSVEYWLRGSRGPLSLDGERDHFGRAGVFHATQSLTPAQAKKVAAAKSYTVQVRPAGAPAYCHEYLDQHLTVRRGAQGGPMWTDTDSTFKRSRKG